MSGNLQDAGGVGGLLSVYSAELNVEASPAYDGNGNVYGLVDRTSGVLRATYEYSPYGESLRSAGELADKNPFRFSSKFTDNETQMLYYGFRYYSPSLGRFFGRDPIEEKGGLHLYAFCRNNGVNGWDVLGRELTQTFVYNTSTPININSGPNGFSVGGISFSFEIQSSGSYPGASPSQFNSKDRSITLANGQKVPMYLANQIVTLNPSAVHIGGNVVRFGQGNEVQLFYQYDPRINGFYLIKAVLPTAPTGIPPPPPQPPPSVQVTKKIPEPTAVAVADPPEAFSDNTISGFYDEIVVSGSF